MQFQQYRQLKSEDLFKIQASCMRWISVWPGVSGTTLKPRHVLWAVANTVFMIAVLVCELLSVYNHTGDLFLQLDIGRVAGMRFLTTVKLIFVILRRGALQELLTSIDSIVTGDNEPPSKKINHGMWRLDSKSSMSLFCLMQIAVAAYVLLPILGMLVTRENHWLLPLQIDIPFDYKNLLLYPITYLASSYSLFLVTTTYVGIDGLFVGCCFYVSAQFKIVRQKIADLFAQEMDQGILTAEQNDQIKKRLIPIIKRHYQCIELTETLVETFAQILFTQFFMIAVILAIHSILMEMSSSIHEIMFFANCIAAGIFHMFMFCKSGTVLTDASTDIVDAIYNIDWHKCDKDVRGMVQLMMVRSQRPCEINAPLIVVSMETFGRILNSTMSFITMLKSFMTF